MPACIARIEEIMKRELAPARNIDRVKEVRVLGTIGVVEMKEPVDVGAFQKRCVERGIWVRPFGRNVYIMPPYVITDEELTGLCRTMLDILP